MLRKVHILGLFIISLIMFIACSPSNKKIQFGTDLCDHCKMTVSDSKYGAEIVTNKGKIYIFDSIECLIGFLEKADSEQKNNFKSYWTVDYLGNGELIDAQNAIYLRNEDFHSPMGLNIASLKNESAIGKFNLKSTSQKLFFKEVVELVKKEWEL